MDDALIQAEDAAGSAKDPEPESGTKTTPTKGSSPNTRKSTGAGRTAVGRSGSRSRRTLATTADEADTVVIDESVEPATPGAAMDVVKTEEEESRGGQAPEEEQEMAAIQPRADNNDEAAAAADVDADGDTVDGDGDEQLEGEDEGKTKRGRGRRATKASAAAQKGQSPGQCASPYRCRGLRTDRMLPPLW